jgi:nuclease-like protein
VFDKEVTPQTYGKDKYGRTIADVLLPDGTNVNHMLVKDGWCWWYRKYAPGNTELEKLEKEAREAKRGLWVDPAPLPLWVYRKARRGQSLDLSDIVPLDCETESISASRGPPQFGAVQPESSLDPTSFRHPSSATDEATATTGLFVWV